MTNVVAAKKVLAGKDLVHLLSAFELKIDKRKKFVFFGCPAIHSLFTNSVVLHFITFNSSKRWDAPVLMHWKGPVPILVLSGVSFRLIQTLIGCSISK